MKNTIADEHVNNLVQLDMGTAKTYNKIVKNIKAEEIHQEVMSYKSVQVKRTVNFSHLVKNFVDTKLGKAQYLINMSHFS
jgi:hypothetical protein